VRVLADAAQLDAFAQADATRLVLFVRDDEFEMPSSAVLRAGFQVAAALYAEHSAFAIAPLRIAPVAASALLADNHAAAGVLLVLSQDEPITELVADASAIGDAVQRNRFAALPCGGNGRLSELVRGVTVLVALIAPVPRPTALKPADDVAFGRQVAELAQLARTVRRTSSSIQFVYVNANDTAHARWLTIVGVKAPVLEPVLIVVRVGAGVVYRAPIAPLVTAGQLSAWIQGVSDDDDDNNAVVAGEMGFAGSGDLYIRHAFGYHWRKRPVLLVLAGATLVGIVLFLAYKFIVRAPRDDAPDDDNANVSRRRRVVDISTPTPAGEEQHAKAE
jgi:hypothetical protein